MSTLTEHLKALVQDLSAELPEVTERRMFGAHGSFANTNLYALVWDGRVVLRFTDPARLAKARALEGAAIFDPTGRGESMSRWVCMPEPMVDQPDELRGWVEEAHREALSEPPRRKKTKTKAKPAKVTPARARAPRTGRARASRT